MSGWLGNQAGKKRDRQTSIGAKGWMQGLAGVLGREKNVNHVAKEIQGWWQLICSLQSLTCTRCHHWPLMTCLGALSHQLRLSNDEA